MNHRYEKFNQETGKLDYLPTNDIDGKLTGKIIMGLKEYFDENPEERIRLGWVKHISFTQDEIKEKVQYDTQSQYLVRTVKQIDANTIEDEYHVMDKSEEMMLLEEMLEAVGFVGHSVGTPFIFFDGANAEVL